MKLPTKYLKQKARISLMGKYLPCISIVFLASAISLLLTYLLNISGFTPYGDTVQKICFAVMNIVILLLEAVLSIGLTHFFLQLTRGIPVSPKDLFYGFTHNPDRFILAAALRYGLLLVSWIPAILYYLRIPVLFECSPSQILTLLGLVLAAVLLNLPVLLLYGQSFYLLLEDPDCGVLESMRQSQLLMHGQKKRLFLLYLSFLGYGLLELGTFGVGQLWIRPYVEMVQIQFFLDITGHGEEKGTEEEDISFHLNS